MYLSPLLTKHRNKTCPDRNKTPVIIGNVNSADIIEGLGYEKWFRILILSMPLYLLGHDRQWPFAPLESQ